MKIVEALRPFVRPVPRGPAGGRCDLCAAPLLDAHRHVVDIAERKLRCACEACGCLFVRDAAGGGRYRTVPERVLVDPALSLTSEKWSRVGIPVGLAFVFRSSAAACWIATFPSPAGATEAALDEAKWAELVAESRLFDAAEEDVEAILVRGDPRDRARPFDCYLVPIDVCYRLIAGVRTNWQGFDGGDEARAVVDALFVEMARRSRRLLAREEGR